jgi:hypothetical protein
VVLLAEADLLLLAHQNKVLAAGDRIGRTPTQNDGSQ